MCVGIDARPLPPLPTAATRGTPPGPLLEAAGVPWARAGWPAGTRVVVGAGACGLLLGVAGVRAGGLGRALDAKARSLAPGVIACSLPVSCAEITIRNSYSSCRLLRSFFMSTHRISNNNNQKLLFVLLFLRYITEVKRSIKLKQVERRKPDTKCNQSAMSMCMSAASQTDAN